MAKIDKLLELMSAQGAERALMVAGRPVLLYVGDENLHGWTLSAAQLNAAIEEILPTDLQQTHRSGGEYQFVYAATRGNYDVDVRGGRAALQITIAAERDHSSTGEMISRPAPKAAVVPTLSNSDLISSPWSVGDDSNSTAFVPEPDYCVLHPTELAAGLCEYSKQYYCRHCLVEINGRFYSKENVERAMAAGSSTAAAAAAERKILEKPIEQEPVPEAGNWFDRVKGIFGGR